jgi:hypothetical protein
VANGGDTAISICEGKGGSDAGESRDRSEKRMLDGCCRHSLNYGLCPLDIRTEDCNQALRGQY